MPSKSRKLSHAEIGAFEAGRDIGAEILQSIKDMKAGKGKVVVPAAVEAREATGLSQSQFASLLGDGFNPLTTPFTANGSGIDSVLDQVAVEVGTGGVVITNLTAPNSDSGAPPAPAVLSTR